MVHLDTTETGITIILEESMMSKKKKKTLKNQLFISIQETHVATMQALNS